MTVPVLTAVTDAVWEADLVAALERGDLGVTVVRRCVDIADLLATAAAGTARAVLLSADLRRLDRGALERLDVARVAVVGLVPPGDESAERRLRQLGVADVLPADAGATAISSAVLHAVAGSGRGARLLGLPGDPRSALPDPPEIVAPPREIPADPARGRVVAVWGPTGAPGRTTVAVNVAAELSRLEVPVLLMDADVYGGAVGQVLGLLDEAPGLAAAARQANAGTLDLPALAGLALTVAPGLRVLTGISRPERWPELRPTAVTAVLDLARRLVPVTVVDCGFSLEQDEELSYDTAAPRRNGATLAVLGAADTVLAVGSADPVGLARLVRGLSDLGEVVPGGDVRVVVNRLRTSTVGSRAAREVDEALVRYAGARPVADVPRDSAALDAAMAAGQVLAEAAPGSPARLALAGLAASVVDRQGEGGVRRHRWRLSRRAG